MPLKIVRRPGSAMLYVRGTVRGQSVFESTETADPERAEGYRIKRENELWDRATYGERAVVTFARAVESYLEAKEHSQTTKAHVKRLLLHLGTTPLAKINQETVDRAYAKILTAGTRASPATKLRAVLTPLRAVMQHAAVRQWCERPAFRSPDVPKVKMAFLRPQEATALVAAAAEHLRPLLTFLIGTGARMSEALELEWKDVDLRGARATVWQKQGTEREIDLSPAVVVALARLPHRQGRLFRPVRARRPKGQKRGKTIGEAYMDTGRTGGGQIKTAWATACRKAGLAGAWRVWIPKGKTKEKRVWVPELTPHCLRHTWATWHYCRNKDLLALREDGGWSTITMVTRYAKKMPEVYRPEIEAWLEGCPPAIEKRG